MASVLLVEDESLIRMMIADMLAELGHSLAGEANDLQSGLLLASAPGVDAAILDIQLGRDSCEPIAEALRGRAFLLPSRADTARAAYPRASRIIRSFKNHSQWTSLSAV
jgi:DNA-binding response OmpR family regulator